MSAMYIRPELALLAVAAAWGIAAAPLAHMSADEVRAFAARAAKGHLDLSGRDMSGDNLSGLDLSGGNLSGAKLSGANLHGVKLLGTNLESADLTDADLTQTWIMNAKFDHAKLHGATLQVIITSQGMENKRETAASFVGADLSNTSATVHFSYDDMRGVNFRGTRQSVVMANQSMGLLRSEFVAADLDGADFTGAQLGRIDFQFAKLRNAVFRDAELTRADFSGAYLSGADFTGATLEGANFEGATLEGAKGLPAAMTPGK